MYFSPWLADGYVSNTKQKKQQQATAGHLVNLATTDVERFQFCAMYINCVWGSPLSALVTLAVGLHVVGISLLAAFAALFMLIPLQARIRIVPLLYGDDLPKQWAVTAGEPHVSILLRMRHCSESVRGGSVRCGAVRCGLTALRLGWMRIYANSLIVAAVFRMKYKS